jgi:hypothetical protein
MILLSKCDGKNNYKNMVSLQFWNSTISGGIVQL